MPDAKFLAANSLYIENVLRHAFLYELSKHLLLQPAPRKLTILNSEVDDSGVDLVLTLGTVTRAVQMKTLSRRHASNPYHIAESLFSLPGGCVIWMCYDPATMERTGYHFLGAKENGVIGDTPECLPALKWQKGVLVPRTGYRGVKSRQARRQDLSLGELSDLLFGSHADQAL